MQQEALLSSVELFRLSGNLAESDVLRAHISAESIDQMVNALGDAVLNADYYSIRKFFIATVISSHAIREVMGDGHGREALHIAGEVCRLTTALRIRSETIMDPAFDEFKRLFNRANTKNSKWKVRNSDYLFPTIDGSRFSGIHEKKYNPATPAYRLPCHAGWLLTLKEDQLPAASTGFLTIIDPPFQLESGEIVAEEKPRFYRLREAGPNGEQITPHELVVV